MWRFLSSQRSQGSEPAETGAEILDGETLRDFNRVLVAVIEDTVSALLGHSVLEALHEHLENHHSISKDALPAHLKTLHEVLQRAIGFAASTTVERAVARALYVRLRIRFRSSSNLTLLEYVDEAKRNLAEQSHSRS